MATRFKPGAISVSNSNILAVIADSDVKKPVIFPPGCGSPATNPSPTGSETVTNTIGIVRVSRWSAAVTGVPCARITSGCRATNSLAKTDGRSRRLVWQYPGREPYRPRSHRRCRTCRPDLGERWLARLVATAEEDRLNISHTN